MFITFTRVFFMKKEIILLLSLLFLGCQNKIKINSLIDLVPADPLLIINYKSKIFLPGKALNLGIKKSKGSLLAIISGHCIPKNENWLNNLVQNFKNSEFQKHKFHNFKNAKTNFKI